MHAPLLFALFVFGGLATYTICERRHRWRWYRRERRPEAQPAGPFRREAGDFEQTLDDEESQNEQ